MATILAFQPRLENYDEKRSKLRDKAAARVIIFPGVRYERMPEISASMVKSAKKNRKTA